MVSGTSFDSLDDISGMHQLTELHISSTRVTDLTGLRNFPRLKLLHITGTRPEVDKSPIAQLTGLTDLAMGGLGEHFDASFIQNMPQLENLHISWYRADADISILKGHPSLRNIEIGGSLPANQSVLLTLPRLETIMFDAQETLSKKVRDELESRGVFRDTPVILLC